jgi:hypothetical protein
MLFFLGSCFHRISIYCLCCFFLIQAISENPTRIPRVVDGSLGCPTTACRSITPKAKSHKTCLLPTLHPVFASVGQAMASDISIHLGKFSIDMLVQFVFFLYLGVHGCVGELNASHLYFCNKRTCVLFPCGLS